MGLSPARRLLLVLQSTATVLPPASVRPPLEIPVLPPFDAKLELGVLALLEKLGTDLRPALVAELTLVRVSLPARALAMAPPSEAALHPRWLAATSNVLVQLHLEPARIDRHLLCGRLADSFKPRYRGVLLVLAPTVLKFHARVLPRVERFLRLVDVEQGNI
eukprot:4663042-Prymnesium_polylepis.1